MERYPRNSAMAQAMGNFYRTQEIHLMNVSDDHVTYAALIKFINTVLYKDYHAYMAPSTQHDIYMSFGSNEDKTAFLLKWG